MAAWAFIRLDFTGDGVGIGPYRAALLEAVDRCGSITAAGAALGISYRQAWSAVQEINRDMGEIIIAKSGRHSGGASVSPEGLALLKRFRKIEQQFHEIFFEDLKYLEDLIGEDPKAPQPIPRRCQILIPDPEKPIKKRKSVPSSVSPRQKKCTRV